MLKRCAYVEDNNGNVCVVYAWCFFLFQLEAFRIQNLQRTPVETEIIPVRFAPSQSCAVIFNYLIITSLFL
jgi:hypothetical protein